MNFRGKANVEKVPKTDDYPSAEKEFWLLSPGRKPKKTKYLIKNDKI